jgi:hypothetical protein
MPEDFSGRLALHVHDTILGVNVFASDLRREFAGC